MALIFYQKALSTCPLHFQNLFILIYDYDFCAVELGQVVKGREISYILNFTTTCGFYPKT